MESFDLNAAPPIPATERVGGRRPEDAADTMGATPAVRAVGAAAGRAHEAIDRATEKASPAVERASFAAHRTVDRAADLAAPAAQWLSDSHEELAQQSARFLGACRDRVRVRPLAWVAGAVAIGYLVGKLSR